MKALRDLLAEQSLFEGIGPDDLDFLAQCGQLVHRTAGEMVFREGEVAAQCFVVRSGAVIVGLHDPARGHVGLASVEPGEVLGWSWMFPPNRWRFDATAGCECSLIAFDAPCFTAKLDEEPHLGYVLMTRLARQASERLLLARMQLADLYNPWPASVPAPSDGRHLS